MSLAKKLYLLIVNVISDSQFIVIPCVFLISQSAIADEFREINVIEENGIYRIEINKTMDVSASYIRDVLSDVVRIYRLNPSIIESEVLASKNGDETRLRTRVLCCVPMFCREVERVDAIRILPSGEIQSKIIPELSDFLSGKAIWRISSVNDGITLISYRATIEPDFYIPPLLGVDIIQKQFTSTLSRIEHVAGINQKRQINNGLLNNQFIVQKDIDSQKHINDHVQ